MKGQTKAKPKNVAVQKLRSAADYIAQRQKFRMQEDLLKLRIAIESAENLVLFDREQLHRIYREVYKDPHFQSQWGTRKLKTIEKEFSIVNQSGEPNDELTDICQSQWFADLIDEILESKVWGFRLIEFGIVDKANKKLLPYRAANGRVYPPVNPIDPDYVKPEWGFVGKDPSDTQGMPFEGGPMDDQLLFVGKRHDFGLLLPATKYILFKNNCIENWSEWAEIFGMDVRIGKTDAEGDAKNKFFKTLEKIGASGYGVIDKEDEIMFAGTSRTDAYKVYEALMDTVDKNVSKLVFGQDVISNNTGHVIGKVGENVSNLYGDSDAKFVSRIINDEVLPRLTKFGLANFNGFKFKWDNTEKLTLKDNADVDYKISQMGWRPTQQYLEDKYGVMLEEAPQPVAPAGKGQNQNPNPNPKALRNQALKELYAGSME